mmetsp:Transcript_48795/g.117560  ORF Transcript_48795/g.117560 Transcript_48795/m.117560 type:complete len:236 (-) Transcript_48795:906-1613(-)
MTAGSSCAAHPCSTTPASLARCGCATQSSGRASGSGCARRSRRRPTLSCPRGGIGASPPASSARRSTLRCEGRTTTTATSRSKSSWRTSTSTRTQSRRPSSRPSRRWRRWSCTRRRSPRCSPAPSGRPRARTRRCSSRCPRSRCSGCCCITGARNASTSPPYSVHLVSRPSSRRRCCRSGGSAPWSCRGRTSALQTSAPRAASAAPRRRRRWWRAVRRRRRRRRLRRRSCRRRRS